MEAKDMLIVDLIGKRDNVFYVPLYQRKYTWDVKDQVKTLWNDLYEFIELSQTGNKDFFLGSLIIKKDNKLNARHILVDGQQRITTVLLLIAALIHASNLKKELDEYATLINYLKSDVDKFKLERINDMEIIKKILLTSQDGLMTITEADKNSNYYKVFEFFVEKIRKANDDKDQFIVTFLTKVLEKIKVAVINLDSNEDEYSVFESINSKGKSLTAADLIKNFIVMHLNDEDELLKTFDNSFVSRFDNDDDLMQFYRQMFAIEEGKLYPEKGKQIYAAFKKKFCGSEGNEVNKNELVTYLKESWNDKIIWDYIHQNNFGYLYYPLMKGNLKNFYALIHVIIKLNSTIINNKITITNKANVDWALKYLTSLVIARALVSFGRVEGNRTYAKLSKDLADEFTTTNDFKTSFKNKVINELNNPTKNYRMPKWEEVSNIELKKDVYADNRNTLKYTLIAIEESISSKHLNGNDISIEHIFPQDSSEWLDIYNKTEFEKVNSYVEMSEWLNTLGNLTIVDASDNSRLSNNVFIDKQKILEEKSYLKINKFLFEWNKWSIESIKDRATKILDKIKNLWFN